MERRTFLSLSAATLALAGCGKQSGEGSSSTSATKKLSLYASSPKDQYEPAVAEFKKNTGIDVQVVSAGTGELIKRIQSEGKNPLGDVQWGGLGETIAVAENSFEEYVTVNDDKILPDYQSAKGGKKLTAFSIIANALMLNNKMVSGISITGWESLLNPALKGKIAFADPAKSSSALSQIINMLHSMGTSGPDSGWAYVEQFIKQLNRKVLGSSSNVYQMVASGEYAVGITNETNAVKYVAAGADVRIVYPSEGNIVLADNVMLIKNSKNQVSGKAFIDYLTSYEYQSVMEKFGLRTVRTDVKQSNFPALSTIPIVKEDKAWLEKNGSTVKEKFQDLFTK